MVRSPNQNGTDSNIKISHPRTGVERVTFLDTGDWWEYKTIFTVAMEREWLSLAMGARLDGNNLDVQELASQTDLLILRSSVDWSYGPPRRWYHRLPFVPSPKYPMTPTALRHFIPYQHFSWVADRMGDYYSPLVEMSAERLAKICSSLLSGDPASQQSSQTPT